MPLSRRYSPEHPPDEDVPYGMDYSFVLPPGVGIQSGTLTIWVNTATPTLSSDFTIGPVNVFGRAVYAQVTGGIEGVDYQFRWSVIDTDGNTWPRTALQLCAQTS